MRRAFLCAAAIATCCCAAAFANDLQSLITEAQQARHDFDQPRAEAAYKALMEHLKTDNSDDAKFAAARAALTVCEFKRYDYGKKETPALEKRTLGRIIDDFAGKAHVLLDSLPDSSEKFRLKADLWGTMIRTDYQGKRFGNDMDNAAKKALQLDENNPNAHITISKRMIFAPERRGGDLENAVNHLTRALELDPTLQQAHILRGIAYEKLGDLERAKADWNAALEQNPKCRPAQENLDRVARGEPLPE